MQLTTVHHHSMDSHQTIINQTRILTQTSMAQRFSNPNLPIISQYVCLSRIGRFAKSLQVQYHQYAPIGPFNTNMLPYQRTVHDLFIQNEVREDVQKRMAATLQTLPNSQLPQQIESYHSLVPLDTTHHKSSSIFGGYHSWVYKAQSSANGNFFVLRRIEGEYTP